MGSDHFPLAVDLGEELRPKKRFIYKINLNKDQKERFLLGLLKDEGTLRFTCHRGLGSV